MTSVCPVLLIGAGILLRGKRMPGTEDGLRPGLAGAAIGTAQRRVPASQRKRGSRPSGGGRDELTARRPKPSPGPACWQRILSVGLMVPTTLSVAV